MADATELSLRELAARFSGLGVPVEAMPGGRCLRGTLRLSAEPFVSVAGTHHYESVGFATAGASHIKCSAPLPFFFLPLIALGGCARAVDLEARIRSAWAAREKDLRAAARRMEACGIRASSEAAGQVLSFRLGHDDPAAAVRALDDRRLILPGRGPLASLRVGSPEQRLARFDAAWRHASDAEIALTDRLENLAVALRASVPSPRATTPAEASRPVAAGLHPGRTSRRLLIVGPQLGRDAPLARLLEQHRFRVRVEFSAHDALQAFREHSYEVVIADSRLGRSEGVELISDLRALPGVENVPVVLVDEHRREQVREAARQIGAAGYLARPLDGERVALGILRILQSRAQRRFRRLPWRLSVRLEDGRSAFTTSVARLGAFLGLDPRGPLDSLGRCEIELPELGQVVRAEAEGIYRVAAAGARAGGVGVLFRTFGGRDEAAWIAYLADLFESRLALTEPL